MLDAGLILEGGGMRGVYTAGVLDFFLDKELEFKEVYGVSAGSCHMCSYLSKQRGRAFRVSTDYLDNPEYLGLRSLAKTGNLFGVKFLYDKIPNELSPYDFDTFEAYKGKAYAVLTNCVTGEAEYHQLRDMRRDIWAVRASSSLPLVSRIVGIKGKLYLDGGIADSIPVRQSVRSGNSKNVVVLTRSADYRKPPQTSAMMRMVRLAYKRYPKLIEQLERRHIHYNETLEMIEEEKKKGSLFVIQPKEKVNISRVEKDREKLEELYHQGYEDAAAGYEAMMLFLSEK